MSTKASCLSTFRLQKSLLLECNSMLDRTCHGPQTATADWISLFASAFSCLHTLGDGSQDIGVAGATDIITHRLAVIAEAVA